MPGRCGWCCDGSINHPLTTPDAIQSSGWSASTVAAGAKNRRRLFINACWQRVAIALDEATRVSVQVVWIGDGADFMSMLAHKSYLRVISP
ncbi:MAG: hypothetical protein KDI44_13605 [Thiothrix sp.]|nr:hypothetical protein [Thiothrix sp.]HPQ95486.1 hypothetical protein [Thiolinea sp.]